MAIPLAIALAIAQLDRNDRGPGTLRDLLLWLSEPEGGRMLIWLIAALVMALALLTTGSRSGLGCFTVMLLGLVLFAGRADRDAPRAG